MPTLLSYCTLSQDTSTGFPNLSRLRIRKQKPDTPLPATGLSFAGGFVGEVTRNVLTVENCYVYGATLSTAGSLAQTVLQKTGVFAGDLWNGRPTIDATNCYFGACGTTENAGAAVEKTEEEFKNGTVAELLGEVFAQAGDYPKFNGPADYSSVDAAIAKANALNKDDYKDFSAVETAINSVVRGKTLAEQAEVDAMAKAIEDAIAALEKKPASTNPGTSDKSQSPQTGDTSNLALWIALLFASGGAAVATTVVSRKKKHNR